MTTEPHHYFDVDHVPLHHYAVKEKGSLIHEIDSADSNSTNSISIVEPKHTTMENAPRKKKDGGMMSRSPTLPPTKSPNLFPKSPTSLSNSPTDFLSTFPSFSPSSGHFKLTLRPTAKPGKTLVPSSGDERSTAYISAASAFAFILLITCAAMKFSKQRQKPVGFGREDPALCGDASISSEHSSTFQCNDEGASMSNHSAAASKLRPIRQGLRRNNAGFVGTKNLISRFFRSKTMKLFAKRSNEKKMNDAVYFAPSTPYLIDNYAGSMQQTSVDETTMNDPCHSFSRPDEFPECNQSVFPSIPNNPQYPDSFVSESERIAWRSALEGFEENSTVEQDPQNRQAVCYDIASRQNNSQIFIDDESTGTIDNMYPEIVRQVKTVDKSLAEGLDQFKAVDKQFSLEIDKLEAIIVRKRNKNNINDYGDVEDTSQHPSSCSSSDVDEFLDKSGSPCRSQLLYDGAQRPAPLLATELSFEKNSIKVNPGGYIHDTDDFSLNNDEKQKKGRLVSSEYLTHLEISNPTKSLLSSNDDELFGNSSTEEEDILSTSNEEFDFHCIRKRFDR